MEHTHDVARDWTPSLVVHDTATGCRLKLEGVAHGDGATLQEAADDLVVKLLNLALCLRASGFATAPHLRLDPRLLHFVWELGDMAARGRDIRERLFGTPAAA